MSKWARRRDNCEREIIDALEHAGASVTRIDATGAPDLLVGYDGRTYLMECKDEHGKQGRGMKRTGTGLRPTQERWHLKWRGRPPAIVTSALEALAVIHGYNNREK